MRVLVVGGGGREHALVWKLAGDSARPAVYCAPGNAGTAACAENLPIGADDLDGLQQWAEQNRPDLTVVGPEAPLCAGIVDRFEAASLPIFGPRRAAAMIEGSKLFAKEVMAAAGVPTARAEAFSDARAAVTYAHRLGAPVVVKADGLAAGKGVSVCGSLEEAEAAIRQAMVDRAFGEAGSRVLVEEFLQGEEASILGLVDGERVVMLASSQDHKAVFEGDRGPNTGGMGAYSPAPVVTEEILDQVRTTVFDPVLQELQRRGIVYRGVLYAGLMVTAGGLKVLEFNCRFGDPETQAILPRLDGNLIPALTACAEGRLKPELVRWRPDPCICVVMASGGYPGPYAKGREIRGLTDAAALDGVVVFHAGTRTEADRIVTAGGRVLGVSALGPDLRGAVRLAYEAAGKIEFMDAHYRKDIGHRALKRLAP